IQTADLVITAEGAIDNQSAYGKTPAGVALVARKYSVPVVGFAGMLGQDFSALQAQGLTAAFSITRGPMELQSAYAQAEANLEQCAEQLALLTHALSKSS
ncbi:MAG: glycerate kinase, partial [Marinobacter sp.]